MGMFDGKKGIIMGVANEYSIASGVAKYLAAEGAELGFSHLPDKPGKSRAEKRAAKVADPLGGKLLRPCDVTKDEDIVEFFKSVSETMGKIDFVVHSIAYCPLEDITCKTIEVSRNGFHVAMDISVFSLIPIAREAAKLMPDGGAILTMSYFGGEKVVAGYNIMGVCKAALESTVQYLAFDLGPQNIRVNGLSAGPIKTLSASAVGDFSDMMALNEAIAPIQKNITQEDIAKASAYLVGDLSSATTGEIHHVDYGYNIMGSPGYALERLGFQRQE